MAAPYDVAPALLCLIDTRLPYTSEAYTRELNQKVRYAHGNLDRKVA